MLRAVVYVCTSCRRQTGPGENDFDQPGPVLAERATALLASSPDIEVRAIDCLAVCKRPCTIALVARDKWTYLIGDLDNTLHAEDVAAAARAFAASANGIVPWRERPLTFRKGVIARVPPLGLADGKTVAPAVLTKVNGT
jgi:predicted metal-binding protein